MKRTEAREKLFTWSKMAPGRKINKSLTGPKKELGKNLFKQRRVLSKRKHQKHKITGANIAGTIADLSLFTAPHLKKKGSKDITTLSGKKRRKLLKQIKHMEREKTTMDLEAPARSSKPTNVMDVEPTTRHRKKAKKGPAAADVEMEEADIQDGE